MSEIGSQAGQILRRLDDLACCTEMPGEITRLFLSPAHAQAIGLVRSWMHAAGLVTELDASGTLIGTRGDLCDPTLIIGSHIDTVRNAGRHDGCLGIVLAIATAERLRDEKLPFTLQIRAFGDEEGIRFPVTLTGAHATAGQFDPAWLAAADADGHTLEDALRQFGLDPSDMAACAATTAFAYLEAHIEQGPVLEAANTSLGVVSAISGASRHTITVTGRAGHAGTVPMAQRQDALVASAHMITAINRAAMEATGALATVGRLAVSPNAVNTIPGTCRFSVDIRAAEDAARTGLETTIMQAIDRIARQHGVLAVSEQTHAARATACDARLQAHIAAALQAAGLPPLHLPSGAGHDAMAIAPLCPIGMLFIRCTGGVSHHPDEDVRADDIAAALDVLTSCVRTLDPALFRSSKAAAWT